MDAAELPIVYHIGLVLAALWAAAAIGFRGSLLYLLAFLYLYMVGTCCYYFLPPSRTLYSLKH